ncbi:MAG: isoprenylcysteine carboxylmethyltransferase family protein [Balneolaceae bacterium]|nr:isoprenylcysteine carboxylmethyltransferase family protein [Balneolaceae bacterium]
MITDIAISVAGFALFALLHSLLADRDLKRKIFKRWPGVQSYYRALYSLISVIILSAWYLLSPFPEGFLYQVPMPYALVFRIVQILGIAGIYFALKPIGALNFLLVTQLDFTSDTSSNSLITSGVYRYVRHPLYSSSMIILLFNPSMSFKLGLITLLFGIYFGIGSIFEERNLKAEFGEVYERYQQEVPRFIPKIPLF